MNELIVSKNEATMSSREMAELTETRHDSVKRTIETLRDKGVIQSPQIVNFNNINGVAGVEYLVCKRDSYIIVAQLSPEMTARLVDRWQELEAKQVKAPAIADPKIAAMMLMLSNLDAVKTQQEAQKLALEHHSARLDGIEAKNSAILDGHGFYSILGYSKLKGVKLDVKQSAAMGKKATAESKKHGIMMGTVPDARHGTVKTYHTDVLEIVFEGIE